MAFADFLRWCSTPSAITVIVGVVLSFVVEWFPKYQNLPPKVKRAVFGAVCFLVPVLVAVIGAAIGIFAWAWEPTFWQAIVAGFVAATSGTAAHIRKL